MKKLLLLLLCVPLMFSCDNKNEENIQTEENPLEKEITVEMWGDGYTGKGTMTILSGDKYVGEWKDGKYNGQGTYTFNSGDKYVGEWKDGKYNGQGTYTCDNGTIVKGLWKDSEFVGSEQFIGK